MVCIQYSTGLCVKICLFGMQLVQEGNKINFMIKKFLTLILPVCFLSFFSLTSCDDLEIPVPFDIPVTVEQNLPFATVQTNAYLRYPEIALNLDVDASIKEKYPKLSINNLKSAKLTGFTIDYISSNLGNKLDIINSAKIYIKAPNLPEVLIGTIENNTNPNQLVINTVDTELIDYLRSKQNSLILEVKGAKSSVDELKVNLKPVFKISLGL